MTPFVSSVRNQTTCPASSRISGPAWSTSFFGAMNRYPGAVPWAAVSTFTGGGRRSGRETKCCVGGFGFEAPALVSVPTVSAEPVVAAVVVVVAVVAAAVTEPPPLQAAAARPVRSSAARSRAAAAALT